MMRNLVLLLYVYIFFLYIFSQNNQLKTGYNVDVADDDEEKK